MLHGKIPLVAFILSQPFAKGKHSFDLEKLTDMICVMIIATEVLSQIHDDISAVRGFL